jgi:hypothetical protein
MPLLINGTTINYLSGPVSANILIPINKNKPVLFLIGEKHREIEKGCDTNSTSMQELLLILNEFASKYETHMYVEEFTKSGMQNFIKNNNCDDIKNEIQEKTPEHVGCLKIVHDDNHHCFYNDYKEKCPEDFQKSCLYSNIIWQYSDIRNIDELMKLRSLDTFIKKICSCLVDTTYYNINFFIQYTYDLYKVQYLNIEDETMNKINLAKLNGTVKVMLRNFIMNKKRRMYLKENYVNNLNDEMKTYYDKYITNISNTYIFENKLNDNEKEEIKKISDRIDYNNSKQFFLNNIEKEIKSLIKRNNINVELIDTYINLLNEDIQIINNYFEIPIIKEQLKNINMTEDKKIKLENDMLYFLKIVNTLNYFVNDEFHGRIMNFINVTFKMIKNYILETNEESKKIIIGNFYDEVKRDFGDDLIITMVKLNNDDKIEFEYFTKRMSALTDMYFLLRTLITTSCPKLIVSLIGVNHMDAQTIYYMNSGEYIVHNFNNLGDIREQCTNLTINSNGVEVNIDLDNEVSQIENYCEQFEQFEETKERTVLKDSGILENNINESIAPTNQSIENNINELVTSNQQPIENKIPQENMEGGKFINKYKKYKKNMKNIKSYKKNIENSKKRHTKKL